jgi:hypothetical protein
MPFSINLLNEGMTNPFNRLPTRASGGAGRTGNVIQSNPPIRPRIFRSDYETNTIVWWIGTADRLACRPFQRIRTSAALRLKRELATTEDEA